MDCQGLAKESYMKAKTVFLLTLLLMFPLTLLAFEQHANSHAGHCEQTHDIHVCRLFASGPINLLKTTGKRNAKNVFLHVNDHLAGELRLFQNQIKGKHSVKGEFIFDNFLKYKTYIQYRVIFKDKKGAVAQTRGEIHLKHGKRQNVGLSTIVLREHDLKNISSYEIRLVASNQELHK